MNLIHQRKSAKSAKIRVIGILFRHFTDDSLIFASELKVMLAHPRIGERKDSKDTFARWSAEEQAGAAASDGAALLQANIEYESRFGHLFVVCATGKTAAEMLTILRARMVNDPETELRVAADEQRKITELRLEKLVLQ